MTLHYREFHLIGYNTANFWRIWIEDNKLIVQAGEIGTEGQKQETTYLSGSEAEDSRDQEVQAILDKGYFELNGERLEAYSPETPSERLTELAGWNTELARLVALNPAAPVELLDRLASHDDQNVRKFVTTNPQTRLETLFELAEEFPNEFAHNPVLDFYSLADISFSNFPIETLCKVFDTFENNGPEWILYAILNHPNSDYWYDQAGGHNTLYYFARQTETKPLTLDLIAKATQKFDDYREVGQYPIGDPRMDWMDSIQRILVDHPNISSTALAILVSDVDREVRRAIAKHPKTSLETLKIIAMDEVPFVRASVIQNPKCPKSIIETLALDSTPKVREAVAQSRKATPKILELFANETDDNVRKALAENPKTPKWILTNLSSDTKWGTRERVARNPNTPVSCLEQLVNDKYQKVRQAAANRLKKSLK